MAKAKNLAMLNYKKTTSFNIFRTSRHSSVVKRLVADEVVLGLFPPNLLTFFKQS